MEEVAFGETEFLGVGWVWIIIVERFDNLASADRVSQAASSCHSPLDRSTDSFRRHDGYCGFRGDGDVVGFRVGLVALDGAPEHLRAMNHRRVMFASTATYIHAETATGGRERGRCGLGLRAPPGRG